MELKIDHMMTQRGRYTVVGAGFYPALSVYGGIFVKRRAGQSPAPTEIIELPLFYNFVTMGMIMGLLLVCL